MSTRSRRRLAIAAALAAITPLGFATKLSGQWWVHDYAGGVLYEIFWMLVWSVWRPAASPARVGAVVFAVTSALEFAQLWQPPWLQALRSTFPGRTLLGTTFGWWDLPHYAVGCALGVALLRALPGYASGSAMSAKRSEAQPGTPK